MIYHQPDWCHHAGITIDPSLVPEDDEIQDEICAAVTDIEHRLIDAGLYTFDDATPTVTSIPAITPPQVAGRSLHGHAGG